MASKTSQFTVTNVDDDDWATRRQPMGDRQMAHERRAGKNCAGAGLRFFQCAECGFEYSNLSYVLLGKIVSRQSGMRFKTTSRKTSRFLWYEEHGVGI